MGRLFLSYCFFLTALVVSEAIAKSTQMPSDLRSVSSLSKTSCLYYGFKYCEFSAFKNRANPLFPAPYPFYGSEKIVSASKTDPLVLDAYSLQSGFEEAVQMDMQTNKQTIFTAADNIQVLPPTQLSSLALQSDNAVASPYYLTSGQSFIPFGRFSTAMISAPLTAKLGQTSLMPVVIGYQAVDSGPFASIYAFRSNIAAGKFDVGSGFDAGYRFQGEDASAELGASYTSSLADANGLQNTGAGASTTFGGFASSSHGSQSIQTVPAVDIHGHLTIGRYQLLAEWLVASRAFREEDLSFNGKGAKPQAGHVEAAVNFTAFDKAAGLALGYQWTEETLALNLPNRRISSVFNIEWWKNTKQRIEYRHDNDFSPNQFANGAAPSGVNNQNSLSSGRSTDTLIAQISIYF